MTYMSTQASNACIYVTYALCLIFGLAVGYHYRRGSYTHGNGTRTWFPLSFNFVASGLGCGIFLTYPQIAATGGLHGLLTYSLCGAIPFVLFATLGPLIRRRCPKGFVLTEWIRERYGIIACLLVSACTCLTIFLFIVGELTSIQYAIETMTGMDGLAALIVECVVAGIYTSLGGFQTSFFTDNIQGLMVVGLVIICSIAIGVNVDIDRSLIGPSGLLKANTLSWKLLYILFVAIMTNDCFMAGFWLRTFASRTNRDLYIGCALGGFFLFAISFLSGVPGLLAVWSGLLDQSSETFEDDSQLAFFTVLLSLPNWINGFVLVFLVTLSTCTLDSLQSALASTVSNDFFRNKVRMIYVRGFVLAMMAPCIVVALRAPNVLNIYLICDILSAIVVPVLFLGLSSKFSFITGFEIVCSVVGGILGVFIFGTVYFGNASDGAGLLLLQQGLYGDDWSAFGAFVAAPVCSVIGAGVGLAARALLVFTSSSSFSGLIPEEHPEFETLGYELFYGSTSKKRLPWYEYFNLGPWARKVDFYVFIQNEAQYQLDDGEAVSISSSADVDSDSVKRKKSAQKVAIRDFLGL